MIGSEKGCIIDIKTKRNVRSIPKWNGSCTRDGKFGLYAPSRGGLELLELRKGSTGNLQKPNMLSKTNKIFFHFNLSIPFLILDSQNFHSKSGRRCFYCDLYVY